MGVAQLDRLMLKAPVLSGIYRANYGRIKRAFHAVNRRVPLARTPACVHWHATYDCNFRCAHCGASGGEHPVDLVDTDTIVRAVEDMGRMGVGRLIITGGEPLVREDIFDVFAAAKAAGVRNLSLATNGYLVEQYAEQIEAVGLDSVFISIDGPDASNDALRGTPGAARRAWKAVDFFARIGVPGRVVNTVVHAGNIRELDDMLDLLAAHHVTLWCPQSPFGVGRSRDNKQIELSDDDLLTLLRFTRKAAKTLPVKMCGHAGFLGPCESFARPKPFFCGGGRETCAILAGGEVVGCQQLYDTDLSMGNIGDTAFSSIWNAHYGAFKMPEPPDTCRDCEYLPACCGGCGAQWRIDGRCLKDVWQAL